MNQNNSTYDRLIRFPEVRKICGLSRSSVWRLQRAGQFPRAYKISSRACAWSLSDLSIWMEEQKSRTKCGN